jgi:hypothetical protein
MTCAFRREPWIARPIDAVHESLPFSVLGRIIHALKVSRNVSRIFDYRRLQIDASFGNPEEDTA